MFKRLSTNTINAILIIGVILLIVEIVFFNGGLVFSVLFSGVFIYIGWRNYKPLWRKILFWIGLVSLIFTILSMIAVRFLVLAVLFIFIRNYLKSRDNPEYISPLVVDNEQEIPKSEQWMVQKLFGNQSTPDHSYEWKDINIHGGIGDRVIDLSETVLPHDEAVISIRHFAGNMIIYIPYEVEVNVHHSALIGRVSIFQYKRTNMFNQIVSFQTSEYGPKKPRVKIITSIVSGDLEVKRI
ncbi:cell wall-active antibiotics response protein LiaF [Halobacillus litoralis]|uniref:cell wall-active antibiotics response protein LiaF n=1 Tax=Halobacillus litoralis TaxID=45668 RepID=UPI001CFF4ED4|nr:cell wall-active antibiotics response protein LiaF [Halobacillus litoralis]